MNIADRICKGFIYLVPSYRKMYNKVERFNIKYPSDKVYTHTDFFLQTVGIGVFFSNHHYPRGFFHKLFYYIGCKSGWLKQHHQECNKSLKIVRERLEQTFEPQLLKLLEEQINE